MCEAGAVTGHREPQPPDTPASAAEPLPEWGANAVGTRFQAGSLTFYRVLSIALALAAVASLVLLVPAVTVSAWAAVMGVLVLAALAASAVNYHLIASYGRTRPAVVITDTDVEVLVPFNRVRVRLADIRQVSVLSRDVMILAPGGIHHGDRTSGARRAVINNVRSFELDRKVLAELIRERARAARPLD